MKYIIKAKLTLSVNKGEEAKSEVFYKEVEDINAATALEKAKTSLNGKWNKTFKGTNVDWNSEFTAYVEVK